MRYYELHPEESVKVFEDNNVIITKLKYIKHDPSKWGQPGMTSVVMRDGGWFGGHPDQLPDIPLELTSLDESLFQNLLKSHEDHGFFPPTAYYLNHDVNAEYAKSEKNGGVLEFPVLYLDAKYDPVCSPSTVRIHVYEVVRHTLTPYPHIRRHPNFRKYSRNSPAI